MMTEEAEHLLQNMFNWEQQNTWGTDPFKYLPHLDESRKLTGILHQKTVGGWMLWKHNSVSKATPHPVHHLSPWIGL